MDFCSEEGSNHILERKFWTGKRLITKTRTFDRNNYLQGKLCSLTFAMYISEQREKLDLNHKLKV